jgi:HEAT repeat protein
MMLSLLRIMDRKDAVPVFREAARGRHFYARWEAVRELLALDVEAALPELEAMAAADAHPEVRAAAGETLAMLAAVQPMEAEPCLG